MSPALAGGFFALADGFSCIGRWVSLMAQMVNNRPAMCKTWVWPLGWKIPWRKAWQPTPVFLLGESPWTGEPGRLQSVGLLWVKHDWVSKHTHTHTPTHTHTEYHLWVIWQKMLFANMIKLWTLRWRDNLILSMWAINTFPSTKEGERNLTHWWGEGKVIDEASTSKGMATALKS